MTPRLFNLEKPLFLVGQRGLSAQLSGLEARLGDTYSADETLKIIQSLYEKKVATYPRVDTTYLSDDIPFASIATAVMWGRSLYRNIQRFVLFQLTINFAAITIPLRFWQ